MPSSRKSMESCSQLLLVTSLTTTSNPITATTRGCTWKHRRRSTHSFRRSTSLKRFISNSSVIDRRTRICGDDESTLSCSSSSSTRSYGHNSTSHCECVGFRPELETWNWGLQWELWICRWLRCFNFSWRLACRSFFVYFICLALVGKAHGEPTHLLGYACEDVSSYYAPVEHMEGEALLKKLNSIISNHRALSYKEVWDALKILDAADVDNPEASPDIVEIYSLRVVPKLLAGKQEGWNREHLWPRSYGLEGGPSLTDLHNLRPADANVNSSRGNKYYGECLATSTHCLKPANIEAAFDTETEKDKWTPPLQAKHLTAHDLMCATNCTLLLPFFHLVLQILTPLIESRLNHTLQPFSSTEGTQMQTLKKVRGDIARAIMYMAVSYGFNQQDGSANLHLSDSPSIKNREMGLLSTLLKWNELDPPSRAEQLRNHRVCRLYQHNRNPFVDHPEYANLIWKQAIPSQPTLESHSLKAWINEFHYNNKGKDHNEFIEVVVGPSTNAGELKVALYNGANGKMYQSLSLTDKRNFHETNGGSGFLIYTAFLMLQNGPADGIALVADEEDDHTVIQFISYQGVVKATDGSAVGIESMDIGLEETEESSELDSIGLTGTQVSEFEWKKFENEASPGKLNIGEILSRS